MQVNLIDFTKHAVEKLIYTKNTRLTLGQDLRDKISGMNPDEKIKELEYIANTIPSSWEFVNYTFEILDVTRAFTHQFVRTRTGSYAQQTMRMLNMQKFGYLVPDGVEKNDAAREIYGRCMHNIQQAYDELIQLGVPEEDARGVLPTNIHTNIIAQFNLRTLAEMARSRTGMRTQSEYRDVFDAMMAEVIKVHPWAQQFLFPFGKDNAGKIEEIITKAFTAGAIDKDTLVEGRKAVDKLKKEF